jgi:putative tricarboxylic transport membrane protein
MDVKATKGRGVFAAPGVAVDLLVWTMTMLHARPERRSLLAGRGWEDAWMTGAEFRAFPAGDRARTATVLTGLGLA